MREGFGSAPWHGKHKMQRNAERLRTVNVGETRWISDYGIGDKGLPRVRIVLDASLPAALEQLQDHGALSLNVALTQAFHAWNKPWIFHHVCHQFFVIAADRIEIET